MLEVGNICVFRESKSTKWRIGRVLQFSYYLEKTKASQQYHGTTVSIPDQHNKIGVLCSWYTLSSPPAKFSAVNSNETHAFYPVNLYICTLSHGCFETIECAKEVHVISVLSTDPSDVDLLTAQHITPTSLSLSYIQNLLGDTGGKSSTSECAATISDDDSRNDSLLGTKEYWTVCGGITLTRKDLQRIRSGKELSDLHVNAFQYILKSSFHV